MNKSKSIMLLVTYKCNLRCSYCYEPKVDNFKMIPSIAKRIIAGQLSSYDNSSPIEIQFMGGEPLLEFPLIREVSEWLWENNFDDDGNMLFAPTNGTLLTKEMKAWFVLNKKRFSLGLSFDGDRVMQNTNRSNSYTKVDLHFFADTWPEQSVKMTIPPASVNQLAKGVKFLHAVGFKYISADLAMGPSVQWRKDSLLAYKLALKELSNYYIDNLDLIPFSMLRLDLSQVGIGKKFKTCGCGEDIVCIDWTGNKYACHLFSPIALPLDKANKSNVILDFRDHSQFVSPVCEKCMLYNLCPHCYGMNYLCMGDVTQASSFYCKAFKLLFVANCRFQWRMAAKRMDLEKLKIINRIIHSIKQS